jgi:hypothetical protein
MNGNEVGARTLAYLRGEKDLFQERERFAQVKKQFHDSGLPSWLSDAQKRKAERFWKIASLLQENSRMSLTDISKELKIPISTVFDTFEELKKTFLFTIILKESEKDGQSRNPTAFEFAFQTSSTAEEGVQSTLNSE